MFHFYNIKYMRSPPPSTEKPWCSYRQKIILLSKNKRFLSNYHISIFPIIGKSTQLGEYFIIIYKKSLKQKKQQKTRVVLPRIYYTEKCTNGYKKMLVCFRKPSARFRKRHQPVLPGRKTIFRKPIA